MYTSKLFQCLLVRSSLLSLGAVDIFTFSLINVNWSFRSDPPPPSLTFPWNFCCPKSHCIPEGILTCTYVKMSTVLTHYTAFTENVVETSNFELSFLLPVLLQNLHTAFSCRCYSIQRSKAEALVHGHHVFCPIRLWRDSPKRTLTLKVCIKKRF